MYIKLKNLLKENIVTIPNRLYHATFKALLPSIFKYGLIPGGKKYINFPGAIKGVYLSNDKNFAASFLEKSESENISDEWLYEIVILTIDTSKLDKNKFKIDPQVSFASIKGEKTPLSFLYEDKIIPSAIIDEEDYYI